MTETNPTIDPAELDRFAAQAGDWWDPAGSFAALHRLNPTRLAYIRERLCAHFDRDSRPLQPFAGLSLIDLGCGGGLAAEPMARLGFRVTAIDASPEAIAAARTHAEAVGLAIDYRVATAEETAAGGERFDTVLALELVEHVADSAPLFAAIGQLTRPGGAFVGATLNRTARSFALAIIGAEYLLGWVPRGTHDWRRFLRPSEFVLGLARNGYTATDLTGLVFDPLRGSWSRSRDLAVNYLVSAVRR